MGDPYSGTVAAAPGSVSFSRPPVVEVVTSVRFSAMPTKAYVSLGELHSADWATNYPRLEEQPRYEPPIETFPGPVPRSVPFDLPLPTPPSLPRLWFVSEQGYDLLQVQQDWFSV